MPLSKNSYFSVKALSVSFKLFCNLFDLFFTCHTADD